jgi:2-keto-4-pentenoate hydratase/2-oxohepta-3-ene-1,7-dioic acid hydratase in catechol pathway
MSADAMADPAGFAIGTFSQDGSASFPAVVVGENAIPFTALGSELADCGSVQALLLDWESGFQLIEQRLGSVAADDRIPVAALTVHAPVQPRQIFCTGANYRQHVADLVAAQASPRTAHMTPDERRAETLKVMDERVRTGQPYAFTKAVSALAGPYDDVVLPDNVTKPDWELELAVVIGRPAYRVGRDTALAHIAGFTVVNDITARDRISRLDMPSIGTDWLAGKSAPTFLPTGPYLVPAAFVSDPMNLHLELKLNGKVMQDATSADMMFDVARQIEHISGCAEILAGDLICTGSPAGNGAHYGRFLRPGDVMEGTIEGIGTIRNCCVAA